MGTYEHFLEVMRRSQVVRFPKHRLATFGESEIQYNLVSPVSNLPPRSTLRVGRVMARKPKILTPELLLQRFEGFGDDSEKFAGWLADNFHEVMRGLQYTFQNKLDGTSPHHLSARQLADNIKRDLDGRDVPRAAVIFSPEVGWQFALMKFILEETTQSFPSNMREIEERGLFDPEQAGHNFRRREIERLFQEARMDPGRVGVLAGRLKKYRLFDQYQDRFFSLVQGSPQ